MGEVSSVTAAIQQRAPSETIRSLGDMPKADYVDTFEASSVPDRPVQEWARAALEHGAGRGGRFLWQRILGLRLNKGAPDDHIAGWQIGASGENWIRLEASSPLMTAHVVIQAGESDLLVTTLVRYKNQIGHLLWAVVSNAHRAAVPGLIRKAIHELG